MIKILFLIHDLGRGGAEKVLVNLVNHMDRSKFDITVMSLFGGGVNEQFLEEHIRYKTVFPGMIRGNSHFMKLFSPQILHRLFIREHYDIEISYLEGPSARIISGCPDPDSKLITWIHSNCFSKKAFSASFRSYKEASICYARFDQIICVSQYMKNNFCQWVPMQSKCRVLYNTIDCDEIKRRAGESVEEISDNSCVRLIAIGTLKTVKGYDRLLRIVKRLHDEREIFHLIILGEGPLKEELSDYVKKNKLEKVVSFLGYQVNPYKYLSHSDLLICSSYSEGFSTVVTEALIIGIPVCTVDVSGMKELLGENNEYGLITDNQEEALYQGIKCLLNDSSLLQHYRKQAKKRGETFHTERTVKAVEGMLLSMVEY